MSFSLFFVALGLACDYTESRPDPTGPFGCNGFKMCANGMEFSLPCQQNNEYFNYDLQYCTTDTSPTACENVSSTSSSPSSSPSSSSSDGAVAQAFTCSACRHGDCLFENPEDRTRRTYIDCTGGQRTDKQCPTNKVFYEGLWNGQGWTSGECFDVCWTDETIYEMCTAISDECGTVDCDSTKCMSEKWEAESSMVEYHYCVLSDRFDPWHVCKGHCTGGKVFEDGRCVSRGGSVVEQETSADGSWTCPDCLGDMCEARSLGHRSVGMNSRSALKNERHARLERLVDALERLMQAEGL